MKYTKGYRGQYIKQQKKENFRDRENSNSIQERHCILGKFSSYMRMVYSSQIRPMVKSDFPFYVMLTFQDYKPLMYSCVICII